MAALLSGLWVTNIVLLVNPKQWWHFCAEWHSIKTSGSRAFFGNVNMVDVPPTISCIECYLITGISAQHRSPNLTGSMSLSLVLLTKCHLKMNSFCLLCVLNLCVWHFIKWHFIKPSHLL